MPVGKPTAATGTFPFAQHRTMAEVIRDEARAISVAQAFDDEENPEVCERFERAAMKRANTRFISALTLARAA